VVVAVAFAVVGGMKALRRRGLVLVSLPSAQSKRSAPKNEADFAPRFKSPAWRALHSDGRESGCGGWGFDDVSIRREEGFIASTH